MPVDAPATASFSSVSSIFRIMSEVKPTETAVAIIKEARKYLDKTEWFWGSFPEESRLAPFLSPCELRGLIGAPSQLSDFRLHSRGDASGAKPAIPRSHHPPLARCSPFRHLRQPHLRPRQGLHLGSRRLCHPRGVRHSRPDRTTLPRLHLGEHPSQEAHSRIGDFDGPSGDRGGCHFGAVYAVHRRR